MTRTTNNTSTKDTDNEYEDDKKNLCQPQEQDDQANPWPADPKRCCDLSKSTLQIQQINLIQMATNPPYIILQQAGH